MSERKRTIAAINQLGKWLDIAVSEESIPQDATPEIKEAVQNVRLELQNAVNYNGWFTVDNVKRACRELVRTWYGENLEKWLNRYHILNKHNHAPKKIAVIMAGNIPLVGFHDFLCVLLSGNYFIGKLSANDNRLFPALLRILYLIDPEMQKHIELSEGKLEGFDAVIATGSNNTSRYFEYYFGKYPHLIRKNRNSICVLDGNETKDELMKLSEDIFMYFGLGCRNVSKLYVSKGYDFAPLFEACEPWRNKLTMHNKYMNNLLYNRSVYLIDGIPFLDNGFVLLKEDIKITSPISVLFYENYEDLRALKEQLKVQADQIQCIVSKPNVIENSVGFGQSQSPSLTDYADGVDVMDFLQRL